MVFFDTPVCRSWISHSHIQPYTEGCDLNASSGVSTSLEQKDTFIGVSRTCIHVCINVGLL